jgi:hypothetical protein
MAGQHLAVSFTLGVDRAEGWRGEGGEHARIRGDGGGDALAAAEPGADELVGVGAVDLGAGRALGGAAGPAGDGQDPAGLVDGCIAVQQFPGGPVDVIDATAQQDGLQAAARVPGRAGGDGGVGQRRYSSRRALAGGGGRAEAGTGRALGHRVCGSAVLCRVWPGWGCLPLSRCGAWLWHRDRAPGESPARVCTVFPRNGDVLATRIPVRGISNQYF